MKDTARPITEVPFPALTICASGLHMNDVEKKLTKDFKEWRARNQRNKTTKKAVNRDAEDFMLKRFQIDPSNSSNEQPISILDILDMMIAPDVGASIAASSVRENAIACKKSAPKGEENECSDFTYTCTDHRFTLSGTKCFYVSEDKANYPKAFDACRALGEPERASLAHISNQAEDDLVFELMKKGDIEPKEQSWVGLKKDNGIFKWQRSRPVNYENWIRSQPNENGDCVAKARLPENKGKWIRESCGVEKRYACSMLATKCDLASSAMKDMIKRKTCVQSGNNNTEKDLAPKLPPIDIFLNPARKEEQKEIIGEKKKIAKNYFQKSDMQALYPELFKILWYSTLPCFKEDNENEHMMISCEFAGLKANCSDFFTRVPSDTGMCCALNVKDSLRESEYRELVDEMQGGGTKTKIPSRDGLRNGLKLTLDLNSNTVSFGTLDQQYNAFNLFIGRPAEFPTMRDKSIQLQAGREHFVDISATVVSTNGIRHMEPRDRRCLFTDESHLDFYKNYTFSNCRLECLIKEVEKKYNCIPWQLPRVGNTWGR